MEFAFSALPTIPPALTPFILAIMSVAVNGVVRMYVNHRAEVRAARMGYRAALLSAFPGLYPEPVRWPDNVRRFLRHAFPQLQQAVEEFRPFVPL
jgi:hypothetical protein